MILKCISTISFSYSILANGEPRGDIQPTRGIRQDDSLSPYLFLLCSEGLNSLIHKAMLVGDIKGFSLCKNSPQISHIFFADDSVLFCHAEVKEIQVIQNIPDRHEQASSQQVNKEKTHLFFGKSVLEMSKNAN